MSLIRAVRLPHSPLREPASKGSIRPQPPTLTHALEHVAQAGQELVIGRIDLQTEQIVERGRSALAATLLAAGGGVLALAGWLLFVAGAIDLLSSRFPRSAVEMAVGLAHVAVGAGVVLNHRRRTAAPQR
jgi:hypothetical protein